jgi:hypothetical protein
LPGGFNRASGNPATRGVEYIERRLLNQIRRLYMAQDWSEDINVRLSGLLARISTLEQMSQRKRGIWIERVMYWLVIIGLIVAVNILAASA